MKICWDNLEEFTIGERNGQLRKGHYTYIEMDACNNCGDPYLMNTNKPSEHCCISCGKYGSDYSHGEETKKKIGLMSLGNKNRLGTPQSEKTKNALAVARKNMVGCNHPMWKGGVIKKGVPLYDTYAHQISCIEEVKPIYEDNLKLLSIRCSKCKKWFIPSTQSVYDRMRYIKEQRNSESRFYCSDECKNSCEVFRQQIWPKNNKPRRKQTFEEFDENDLKIWREEVLKNSDYLCEYCWEIATIAHHIKPKKLEPFLALDPENGIACCVTCHNKYGHSKECSTWSLAHIKCD